MRLNFYSNVGNQDVIKKAIANVYNDTAMTLNTTTNASKSKTTVSVNPLNATPSDTYTFLEEFDEEFET